MDRERASRPRQLCTSSVSVVPLWAAARLSRAVARSLRSRPRNSGEAAESPGRRFPRKRALTHADQAAPARLRGTVRSWPMAVPSRNGTGGH